MDVEMEGMINGKANGRGRQDEATIQDSNYGNDTDGRRRHVKGVKHRRIVKGKGNGGRREETIQDW